MKSLLPTPIAVMKEREEARALRTDRGERLAVRRSPTRFRCAFFGPSQLHARRSGRCAGGGVAPIALASGAKLRACQVRTAAAQIAPGGAKCDFSPSDAESHLRGCGVFSARPRATCRVASGDVGLPGSAGHVGQSRCTASRGGRATHTPWCANDAGRWLCEGRCRTGRARQVAGRATYS